MLSLATTTQRFWFPVSSTEVESHPVNSLNTIISFPQERPFATMFSMAVTFCTIAYGLSLVGIGTSMASASLVDPSVILQPIPAFISLFILLSVFSIAYYIDEYYFADRRVVPITIVRNIVRCAAFSAFYLAIPVSRRYKNGFVAKPRRKMTRFLTFILSTFLPTG